MVYDDRVITAATNLGFRLQGNAWFSSIGVSEENGKTILIVYLRKRPKVHDDPIPKTWDGIPVRLSEIGKVRSLQFRA